MNAAQPCASCKYYKISRDGDMQARTRARRGDTPLGGYRGEKKIEKNICLKGKEESSSARSSPKSHLAGFFAEEKKRGEGLRDSTRRRVKSGKHETGDDVRSKCSFGFDPNSTSDTRLLTANVPFFE